MCISLQHELSSQQAAACLQTYAMQRTLAKFGILELARTGKICLKRGEEMLDMGGWGEGLVPRLRSAHTRDKSDETATGSEASSHGDVYDDSSMQPEGPGERSCPGTAFNRCLLSIRHLTGWSGSLLVMLWLCRSCLACCIRHRVQLLQHHPASHFVLQGQELRSLAMGRRVGSR